MLLYKQGKIMLTDLNKLKKLKTWLNCNADLDDPSMLKESVSLLLDKYSFAATKYILTKAREFCSENNKKLMVVLFDPGRTTRTLITSGTRYDQEIVDFLRENSFNYFDMNLVHADDFKCFNLTVDQYYKRYFIGHYNPAGNHFFAFSICPRIIEWLDPKPIIYKEDKQKMIDFKGYLNDM
jgi:hypothetical protein